MPNRKWSKSWTIFATALCLPFLGCAAKPSVCPKAQVPPSLVKPLKQTTVKRMDEILSGSTPRLQQENTQ